MRSKVSRTQPWECLEHELRLRAQHKRGELQHPRARRQPDGHAPRTRHVDAEGDVAGTSRSAPPMRPVASSLGASQRCAWIVAVLICSQTPGGRWAFAMAAPTACVECVRDSRIARRLAGVYRQSTLRPAKLIDVVPSLVKRTRRNGAELSRPVGQYHFHQSSV